MYQDEFEINEYHFKCKGELGLCVLARTKETALEIVKIINDRYPDKNPYVPKRLKFVTHCVTDIPPYEVEQECFKYAKSMVR